MDELAILHVNNNRYWENTSFLIIIEYHYDGFGLRTANPRKLGFLINGSGWGVISIFKILFIFLTSVN